MCLGFCYGHGNTIEVEISIPELNPEMVRDFFYYSKKGYLELIISYDAQDVYRIGTLMELVRVLALSFADDGKRVKVCVQWSMGEGALSGMPLQLAGSRKILEFMDWGDYGAMGTFINIGSIGAKEVNEQDDMFILVAPQNAVGNCIIYDLEAMTNAAGNRPVILVNPRLKDLPGSSGIMQARNIQLWVLSALDIRMSYPYRYEVYKRIDESLGKEKYIILNTFPEKPGVDEINDSFEGKPSSFDFDLSPAETKKKPQAFGRKEGIFESHTESKTKDSFSDEL
ncbi:hypothetical protein HHK36_006332 [Tetracentron sinense]|uniref:DUF1995 domain-containing protein n=1 Tax=Tetracentron sinense TaxID=13715 RepID=A0A834ZK85_TETSI|nr:hypothetical protein HHK36_006332 [Tetracentron sinense]